MKVIGIEKVDYISKKTNNRVFGYNIYCTKKINENIGFGEKLEKVYISNAYVSDITDLFTSDFINTEVDFSYNKYGNVTHIIVL